MKGYTKRLGVHVTLQMSISEYVFHKGPFILILQTNVNEKRDILCYVWYIVFLVFYRAVFTSSRSELSSFRGVRHLALVKKRRRKYIYFFIFQTFSRGVSYRYLKPPVLDTFLKIDISMITYMFFLLKKEISERSHEQ